MNAIIEKLRFEGFNEIRAYWVGSKAWMVIGTRR